MYRRLRIKIIERYDSQAEFAIQLSIDESLVSRVIHGRKKLNEVERTRWYYALDCKEKDIFDV